MEAGNSFLIYTFVHLAYDWNIDSRPCFGNQHQMIFLVPILFFSLLLRLILVNQSLWLDEAIGALVVKNQSLLEILTRFPLGDNHPPLYYLTLKVWTSLFGYSELALRSLSVLFGLLTIIFVFKMAKLIDEKKNVLYPVFGSLLLATSQIHIYYSQEARMYVMAAFLATAAIYYFLKTLDKKPRIRDFVLFSLFYTALIFTDYTPVFLYPVFFLYPLWKKKDKKWWLCFLSANVPLMILGYLWLPTFIYQSARGKWLLDTLPAWQELAGGATIKQGLLIWAKFVFGRISFVSKKLYLLVVGFVSLPYLFLFFTRPRLVSLVGSLSSRTCVGRARWAALIASALNGSPCSWASRTTLSICSMNV